MQQGLLERDSHVVSFRRKQRYALTLSAECAALTCALCCKLQTGDRLTSGDIYATVHENSLLDHRIMVPPGAKGNVTYIAPAGEYSLTDKVLELEFGGVKKVRPRLSPDCKWLPATNPCPATANPLRLVWL